MPFQPWWFGIRNLFLMRRIGYWVTQIMRVTFPRLFFSKFLNALAASSSTWAKEAPESASPEWQYQDRQVSNRIQQALSQLTIDDRTVITLRHFNECSYQEIAEILVLEEKTVKSRIFEARRRLAKLLGDLRMVTV